MLHIKTNKLAAALYCSAVKDVRYYLNGVHIEVTQSGTLHIVSTNGHSLFAGKVENPDWAAPEPLPAGFTMTIPSEAIKTAIKAKSKFLTLAKIKDDLYSLGDVMFTPIDAKYPDWRRVAKLIEGDESPSQFNPEYLVACNKALKTWSEGKATFQAYVHARGESAGALTGSDDTAFCILMPVRSHTIGKSRPFIPADL